MAGSSVADIRNSFGAAFIGLLVSTTLFGVTIVQTWIYLWHYRDRDQKTVKLFIAFITVMDALHTFLCAYAVYWYLILNFGNVENLDYSMWALHAQVVISILVGSSVQLYYARRVYKLSRSLIFPIIIVALVVFGFSLGFLFTAKEIILKRFSNYQPLTWLTCVGMSAAALADILIAATMCWSLYRKRTGFARTDSVIMALMAYSINSGLLTSLLCTAMTISFVVSPSSQIWMAIFWAMSKCYVNSFLAILNSRDYVRDRSTTDNPDNAINLSSIRIDPLAEAYGSKPRQAGVTVSVHRSTTSDFGRNKFDRDVLEPAFEISKPGASIIPLQNQGQTSESSA